MTYYGFITTNATVIIIGTDKQEVETHFTINGFNESDVQKKRFARFTYSTDSSMITLTGFETNTALTEAIKEETATLEEKKDKTIVTAFLERIAAITSNAS